MSQFNSVLENFIQVKDFYEKNPTKKNATLYRKALLNIRAVVGDERKAVLEKSKPHTDEKTVDVTDEKTEPKTEPIEPVKKPRTRKPKAEAVEVVSDPTVTPEKPKRRNNKKPVVETENKTA